LDTDGLTTSKFGYNGLLCREPKIT